MPGVELKVDWCSHKAAKFACENWHYSKSMPVPPLVKLGVWEFGKFIGVVIFSRGANNNLVSRYGIALEQGCELSRVALTAHYVEVSKVISVAIRFLKKSNKGLKLIVSFADQEQGHNGAIYQAGNWTYCGETPKGKEYLHKGKKLHPRQISEKGYNTQFGQNRKCVKPSQCEIKQTEGKHRYLMPLDKETRKKVALLAKPYPKRAK